MSGRQLAAASGYQAVNNGSPFKVVSWRDDFLSALLDFAMEQSGGDLSGCLFIFPHARPALYLERLLRQDARIAKPCLMPEIMPVHGVFQKIRLEFAEPAITAGKLDQVGLLLECVRAEQTKNPGSINTLPTGDARAFFPWGVRLANLYEDCFIHGIQPTNFMFMEGELAEYAAALLSRLGNIHAAYTQALLERNWTTSALTAFEIAKRLRSGLPLPAFLQDRLVYIAGFYSPNGTEDTLFRKLWSNGAEIVLHTDPALAGSGLKTGNKPHWSCAEMEQWRAAWRASFELLGQTGANGPVFRYYSGFDVHSQLAALQKVLALENEAKLQEEAPKAPLRQDLEKDFTQYGKQDVAQGDESASTRSNRQDDGRNGIRNIKQDGDTAIILPDADLLLPVLHHLRDRDLNISMGYPLGQTALARLLECVLTLQENRRPGGYYWKDCVRLIRHPYVKMLIGGKMAANQPDRPDVKSEEGRNAWRAFLYRLEKNLREGKRFVDLPALMRQTLLGFGDEAGRQEVAELLEALISCLLGAWDNLSSLAQAASSLELLCGMLRQWGERLWPSFPIDAECLYRFMQSVIPQLQNSALSAEQLSADVLFTILRQLIREERVPFDAFPLTALQIMGLLESRLLRFKRVFILEATDDLLPGAAASDPLLPDNLRRELGLPDTFRKQQMIAYYFFRLINGADEVHLFWEEGVEAQGLQEGKKLKSRFVEELLWREEKKAGKLLKPAQFDLTGEISPTASGAEPGLKTNDNPASNASSNGRYLQIACAPGALNIENFRQELAGYAGRLMQACLTDHNRPLSASRINTFMTCPLAFYLQELVRLKPIGEVAEGDDPSETGQLLHDSFSRFYGKKLGCELTTQEREWPELVNDFRQIMSENQVIADFPQDAQAALRRITPLRLESYLGNQPGNVKVLALESEANAELTLPDGSLFRLTGRLDRLDERPFPQLQSVELDRNGEPVAEPAASGFSAPEKGLVILDYKTGKLRHPAKDFWRNASLWGKIFSALKNTTDNACSNREVWEERRALMREIAGQLNRNIQLPLYLYLLRHGRLDRAKGLVCDAPFDERTVMNAAWVELRSKGEEHYLLDEEDLPDLPEILDKKLPALLGFILLHMKNSVSLEPERGDHCAYCAYASICSRLAGK